MTHNASIVATDAFWALIALIIFCIILYVLKIPTLLSSKLDARALDVAKELEDARVLKEKAQQNLVDCQKKCKEIQEEAHNLLKRATREAEQIKNEARKATEKYIEQQRILAKEKMQLALAEASKDIKNHAVDVIIKTTQDIIEQELTENKNTQIVLSSLNNIKHRLI